jgi:hypothetical protein
MVNVILLQNNGNCLVGIQLMVPIDRAIENALVLSLR